MNSGFIKITNRQIIFANNYFINIALKLRFIDENDKINTKKITDMTQGILLDVFYRLDITKENSKRNCDESLKISNDDILNKSFNNIKEFILLNKKENEDCFIFLGQAILNEPSINLDLVYECYANNYMSDKGEVFEIIFNDVTRTKKIEEQNADIKTKTTYLSKITHEFKNPLLCLSEIIDEEFSTFEPKQSVTTIKSISNYLLILVKNIDLFSQMQSQCPYEKERISKLNIAACSLNEVFDFIKLIANYLIKRKKADHVLQFEIINYSKVETIETDEVKLKQILINLISNSLKFTLKGIVTLTVYEENDDNHYLKCLVKDTGIGISEDLKSFIQSFLKYYKEHS